MAARYCKELAEVYEDDTDFDQALHWYEKAADLFQSEEDSTSANQCRQKIAEYTAELAQYAKASEIFEDIAWYSLSSTSLQHEVKDLFLHAGICHLCDCKGDTVSVTNALDKYQDMDPTFTGTRECKLLSDLTSAINEKDVSKFTAIIREFDRATYLGPWKTNHLLRVKARLINPDMDDNDLS